MIVQGGEVHGALVAEKTELEFVCVVAVGYLDSGQASLVDAVAGIARLSHSAVADLWNVLDRSIEINPETCDWVFDAGGIATKYQDWVWQEGGGGTSPTNVLAIALPSGVLRNGDSCGGWCNDTQDEGENEHGERFLSNGLNVRREDVA